MIITILYLCQFACIDSDEDNQIPWISIYFARSAYYHRQKRRKWAITSNANGYFGRLFRHEVLCPMSVRFSTCVGMCPYVRYNSWLAYDYLLSSKTRQIRYINGMACFCLMSRTTRIFFTVDLSSYQRWPLRFSLFFSLSLSLFLSLSLSLFLSLSLPHTRAIKGSPQ